MNKNSHVVTQQADNHTLLPNLDANLYNLAAYLSERIGRTSCISERGSEHLRVG
jgi:hypothetical protein